MSDSATLPVATSPYGYTPTLYVCAIFIALFGLSALIHVGQAIHSRMWWLFPTAALAGLAEVIGWVGRLWSSQNAPLLTPFLMQITTTIIAPTPLVAANFVILGRIIGVLGRQYSRLSPKWYTIIFCTCDIIALIVQAVGGASASQAAEQHRNASKGGNIMLGGIAFQMVAITVYVACAAEFLFRFLRNKPLHAAFQAPLEDGVRPTSIQSDATVSEPRAAAPGSEKSQSFHSHPAISNNYKQMLFGLILSTLVIFIRSVYRVIELADGWGGRIIHTERYFNVLDGAMIVIAMFTLNAFHPGRLLTKA